MQDLKFKPNMGYGGVVGAAPWRTYIVLPYKVLKCQKIRSTF